jgi:acetylornithine deacetylase/succinyl-diaminopimelate desuccinylase-like protein
MRAPELRFTEAETAAFLEQHMETPADDGTVSALMERLEDWLDSVIERHKDAFPTHPQMEYGLRWMHPAEIDPAHPMVTTLQGAITQATGRPPEVKGAPYQCDMWTLHRTFNMPAVVFGPAGGNSHAADTSISPPTPTASSRPYSWRS